jgi:hypothetical protein
MHDDKLLGRVSFGCLCAHLFLVVCGLEPAAEAVLHLCYQWGARAAVGVVWLLETRP